MTNDSKLQPTDKPCRNPVAASRTYDDEGVVIHAGSMELSVLNPIGTRIWELVDGDRSVEAIVTVVTEEFEVDRSTAESDVQEFLQELRSRDLVHLEGEDAN